MPTASPLSFSRTRPGEVVKGWECGVCNSIEYCPIIGSTPPKSANFALQAAVKIGQWEGRHAIAVPGQALRAIYKRRSTDGNSAVGAYPDLSDPK